jgi:hypothetical protein
MAVLVCAFSIFNQGSEALVEGETLSVVLVVLGAIIESPSEIYYLQSLTSLTLSARIKAEGGSLFCKQVLTYALLRADFGLLSYSISWLVQSILLNLFYFIFQKAPAPSSKVESVSVTPA